MFVYYSREENSLKVTNGGTSIWLDEKSKFQT